MGAKQVGEELSKILSIWTYITIFFRAIHVNVEDALMVSTREVHQQKSLAIKQGINLVNYIYIYFLRKLNSRPKFFGGSWHLGPILLLWVVGGSQFLCFFSKFLLVKVKMVILSKYLSSTSKLHAELMILLCKKIRVRDLHVKKVENAAWNPSCKGMYTGVYE